MNTFNRILSSETFREIMVGEGVISDFHARVRRREKRGNSKNKTKQNKTKLNKTKRNETKQNKTKKKKKQGKKKNEEKSGGVWIKLSYGRFTPRRNSGHAIPYFPKKDFCIDEKRWAEKTERLK